MAQWLIAGAGAAGLFAAGRALALGHEVTLVEHMPKPGRKLLVTGKGRCNLTNNCDEDTFLQGVRRNPRFLYSALYGLPPGAVMRLFEDGLGLPLKTERGRRVFPASDRAADVLEALLRWSHGARMLRGEVEALLIQEGRAAGLKLADGRKLYADAVLVATGGLSYQNLGASGVGYALARQAGHSVLAPRPSLVALVERGNTAGQMQGLALRNVALTLYEDDRPVYREQGEMLFTHFGLSGPIVLSASAYVQDEGKYRYRVCIDLKPALNAEALDERLQRDFAEFANRDAANALDKLLPAKMRPVILRAWGVEPRRKANGITREERHRLGALLKAFPVEIAGLGDLAHAVVTAGGVNVKEIDPKTMRSKCLPGLYFAGEVLDVDGYTGGYNLHIAWCTAWAAVGALP